MMAPGETGGNENQLRNVPNILPSISGASAPFPTSNVQPVNPPPVPPRPPIQNYSGFNDFQRPCGSNYYGGYGFGGYGNQYRGHGGYNSYGYNPFSHYNHHGTFGGHSGAIGNRFSQYVEDNSRPTFHLIETVLHTFSSMTMLLESTYFSLTSSFRAILSVAESYGRLRSTVGQLFNTFALIRFLKWLYRKIVRGTRFQDQNSVNEELWDKSLAKVGNENISNSSYWSGFLMFGVFIVIPYMIQKLANSIKPMETKGKNPKNWHQYEEPAYIANVLYDFTATNNDELSIKAGQKICLAPVTLQPKNIPGWYKATDNTRVGLVPSNYIKIMGQLKKVKKNNQTAVVHQDKVLTPKNHSKDDKNNSETAKNNESVQ